MMKQLLLSPRLVLILFFCSFSSLFFLISLIFLCVTSRFLTNFCLSFLFLPFKCLMVLCESFMLKGWAKVLTENSASLEEQTVSKKASMKRGLAAFLGTYKANVICASYLEQISIYPEDFLILCLGKHRPGFCFRVPCWGLTTQNENNSLLASANGMPHPTPFTLPPTRITKFLGYIRGGIFTDLPRLGRGWVSDFRIWQEEAKSLRLFLMKSQHPSFCSHLYPSLCLDLRAFKCFLKLNQLASSWPSSLPMHHTKAGAQLYVSHRCGALVLSPWHPWKPSRYCSSQRTVLTMKTQTQQNMDTCQVSGYNRIKTTLMNLPASGPLPLTWH